MPSSRPSSLRLVASTALLALTAGTASAQLAPTMVDSSAIARRGFADSWFWGVKGGATRFGTVTDGNKIAALAGFDWLVTRHRAALLVGAEQAFFRHTSAVAEPGRPGTARIVDLRDARRYSASILAVPGPLGGIRPYAGIGIGLDVLREATPRGDFASSSQRAAIHDEIDAGRSKASLILLGGGQVQVGRTAFFLQVSGSPSQTTTLWNRGGVAQLEGGLRFNLASAQER